MCVCVCLFVGEKTERIRIPGKCRDYQREAAAIKLSYYTTHDNVCTSSLLSYTYCEHKLKAKPTV